MTTSSAIGYNIRMGKISLVRKVVLMTTLLPLLMCSASFMTEFDMVYTGDASGAGYFRIPALLTLRNPDGSLTDTVIAVQDVRFSGFGDSPANIDSGIRISHDAGRTFDEHRLLSPYAFRDVADGERHKSDSASFIDCSLFQNYETGRLFVTVNMFPWGGGIMGGNVEAGTPFVEKDGETVMLLTATTAAVDLIESGKVPDSEKIWNSAPSLSDVRQLGTYYAKKISEYPVYQTDASGAIRFDENGYALLKEPFKRKIYDENGRYTKFFLNERYEVCYDDGTDRGIILKVEQIGGDETVPMNAAFKYSIFQMFRTSYNFLIYSDDKGQTWSDPINLTGMIQKPTENVTYQIASPGTGLYVDRGPYKGRVMFACYMNTSPDGAVKAEVPVAVWSDDNGKTWTRGETLTALGDTVKMSESVLTVMPDGNIRIFSRTGSSRVGTALSLDGGKTWQTAQKITKIYNSGPSGCQITVFNYPDKIDGCDALILASPQSLVARRNGTVWVGLIRDDSGNEIDWTPTKVHDGAYAYSCATPLAIYSESGFPSVGLYAELEGNRMHYGILSFDDLHH